MVKFQSQIGKQYDRVQLKNKWDHLKKEWKLRTDLKREEIGLGWNASRKTIDTSYQWWDERLKVVPNAKKFRYGGIPPELEEKLNIVFSSVVATGQHACNPATRSLERECVDERAMYEDEESEIQPPPTDSFAASTSSSNRCRKEKKNASRDALEHLAKFSKIMSSYFQDKAKGFCFSIQEMVARLSSYSEVQSDEQFFNFALTYIMDDRHRELFMSLPDGMNIK